MPGERASAAFPGANGKIAFTWDRDGVQGPADSEIFTVWFEGSDLKRLTNNSGEEGAPAWSADGKKIVFSRRPDESFQGPRDSEIFVMNADGSDRRRITAERNIPGTARADDFDPAFSPSGRQIVFARGDSINNGIFKIRTDGTNPQELDTPSDPAFDSEWNPVWSPDGSKIAFEYSALFGFNYVVTINPDGSGERGLYHIGEDPDWSPDTSRLLFTRHGNKVCKMNADGTNQQCLVRHRGYNVLPAFSPGGSKIVFSSDRDGDFDLYTKDADGDNLRRLTNLRGDELAPDWQPVRSDIAES